MELTMEGGKIQERFLSGGMREVDEMQGTLSCTELCFF